MFLSWHPELPPFLRVLVRSERTKAVMDGLFRLDEYYAECGGRMSLIWKHYKKERIDGIEDIVSALAE